MAFGIDMAHSMCISILSMDYEELLGSSLHRRYGYVEIHVYKRFMASANALARELTTLYLIAFIGSSVDRQVHPMFCCELRPRRDTPAPIP